MPKSVMSPSRLVTIAVFALSCFGLLLFLWLAFGGPIPLKPKGYQFQVAFDDAVTLAQQSDVRVAGVSIGTVVAKKRDPAGNRSLATIEVEAKYAPIRSDARAILRQKTLLGETYVEMTLGSSKAPPIPENGRLENGQVADVVEFDELLRIFDPPTRKAFAEWQSTLADASRGRARDINDALGNLPVFVESAQGVVETLDRRRDELQALIRGTGDTFEAITRNEGALSNLIVKNTQVFETLAGRRESLYETFQVFPTFERESRATFDRLARFARDTDPLIVDLEPVLEDARPTLASLRRLAPDAERLFRDLDPLIVAGRQGLPALARVLRGLDPTLASVGPFLQQINPILQYLEASQPTVSDFLNVGPSALGIKVPVQAGSESNGHALPQLIVDGSQSIPAGQTRSEDNRGNAYFKPGSLNFDGYKEGFFVFPNWDCDHVGGRQKATEEQVGCFVQDPIPFKDSLRRFPHVEAGPPGG